MQWQDCRVQRGRWNCQRRTSNPHLSWLLINFWDNHILYNMYCEHSDTHLDALDTYIYFLHILVTNFDLHTNIAMTISDEFSQYLDRVFGSFLRFLDRIKSYSLLIAQYHHQHFPFTDNTWTVQHLVSWILLTSSRHTLECPIGSNLLSVHRIWFLWYCFVTTVMLLHYKLFMTRFYLFIFYFTIFMTYFWLHQKDHMHISIKVLFWSL